MLSKVRMVVQTIIPEPFRFSESNKVGVLKHPVDVAIGTAGSMYITDIGAGTIFKARLHYPVDISELESNLIQPFGVCRVEDVVFVCELGKNRIIYYDLSYKTCLRPNKMKKDELISVLAKKGRTSIKKSVIELRKDVEIHLQSLKPSPASSNSVFFELALDRSIDKPVAIDGFYHSNEKTWHLMNSSPTNKCLFEVSVHSDGAKLV